MEYKLNIKKNTCSQRLGNCSEFRMMTMYSYANAIFDHHETLKFGLSAFISSVGGNLGLFLGFSILSTLMAIYSGANKLKAWLIGLFCHFNECI